MDKNKWALRIVIALIGAVLLWMSWGCSGSDRLKTLQDSLLTTPPATTTNFNLSINAVCDSCSENEVPVTGLHIEVYQKDDPMHILVQKMLGGLGSFSLTGINAYKGGTLSIEGTLMLEGSANVPIVSGYTEATVPDEDGSTVSATLKFPSSATP